MREQRKRRARGRTQEREPRVGGSRVDSVAVGQVAREGAVEFVGGEAGEHERGNGHQPVDVRDQRGDGPREDPEADGEDGGRDGEADEFVFGLERLVLLAAALEHAAVVQADEDSASEADGDGDEG